MRAKRIYFGLPQTHNFFFFFFWLVFTVICKCFYPIKHSGRSWFTQAFSVITHKVFYKEVSNLRDKNNSRPLLIHFAVLAASSLIIRQEDVQSRGIDY